MKNPFLIGKHIYLSPIELNDLDIYLRWFNDREVSGVLKMAFPISREAEQRKLEEMVTSETDVVLAIRLKEQDKLIGGIGLHRINHVNRSAVFGIVIGEKEAWAQGYGTEATRLIISYGFGTLNLHRIGLEVFSYNQRAIRCYEKVGFVKEGVLREAKYHKGRYYDSIQMGILKQEWEALAWEH